MEQMIRTIILVIGWPVLVGGSIYLFVQGREVYGLVRGALIGQVTRALVWSMLSGMYCLGVVATFLMYADENVGVWIVLPIFVIWFGFFVWSLKVLLAAKKETQKMLGGK